MKQKTKKAVTKRIKVTAGGKLLRRKTGGRHIRRNKSAAQKRAFRKHHQVVNKRIARRFKRLMALS